MFAYHLTWTTYGTWLPGDRRGWIESSVVGIQSPDPKREDAASAIMVETAVTLSNRQRKIVERTIREHCDIRKWRLNAVNARSNHVHVVVTADRAPDEVMNQLKAWCSRRLSDDARLTVPVAIKAGRRRWFSEGGNKEIIEDEKYLQNAIRYVIEGQDKSPTRKSPTRQQG
jgi:REP element-mobilizing transposase RayT